MKLRAFIKKFFAEENNFDFYPDAVIVIDQYNNITRWNIKANEVFGFTREEMIGRNLAILFDSELEKIYESSNTNKINVIQSKNKLDENIFVEVACRSFPKQKSIMITLRDVTKNQRVIEKLLIEYETVAKINKNKSNFLYSLSGNIKTPLHSLIGFSQGLLDGICGELTEKQSKYMGIINKNANNLLEVVDDLLALSGLESGKLELNLKVFDVTKTLNTLCSRLQQIADKKGLQFETDFNDIVKKNIYSDEALLSRVISSVLENAIKFTDIGSVRLKVLHPDTEIHKITGLEMPENFNDKSYLLFNVTDTGVGLTEEDISLIFDEFVQPNRPTVKKYGGTGLKLALARRILASFGGSIWVESEPGQGSTFSFVIPIERQTERQTESQQVEEPQSL